MDEIITIVIKNIRKYWHSITGLILLTLLLLCLTLIMLDRWELSVLIACIVFVLSEIAIVIIWLLSNSYPKTNKNKIGFAVCIRCYQDQEYEKIREDFIYNLRNLIKSGDIGSSFHFIEVPQHIAERINDIDDAQILRSKMKAHFLIFGRVRLRNIQGRDCHILDLDGVVAHKPIPQNVSRKLSIEFRELLPKQMHIPMENDLLSFQATSDLTEWVAKYIIGIAAECSGSLGYAEKLFNDVQRKVNNTSINSFIITKLKQRLPIRLKEINEAKATVYIQKWKETKEQQYIDLYNEALNNIPKKAIKNDKYIMLLQAIGVFLNGRKVGEALQLMKKAKGINDPIWHFNFAFLKAYQGDLKTAVKHYRISEKYEFMPMAIDQVEDFLVWMTEEEPDKIQFHCCLGYFNWKIKEDHKQAIIDFEKFVILAEERGLFKVEMDLAANWIAEIKNIENFD